MNQYHQNTQGIPFPSMENNQNPPHQTIEFHQYPNPIQPQYESNQNHYNQQIYSGQFNNHETDEQIALRLRNEDIQRQQQQQQYLQQNSEQLQKDPKKQQQQQNHNRYSGYDYTNEAVEEVAIIIDEQISSNNQMQNPVFYPTSSPPPPPPPYQYNEGIYQENNPQNQNQMYPPQMNPPYPPNPLNDSQYGKLRTLKKKSTQLRSSMTYRKSNTASNKIQNYSDREVYLYSDRQNYHTDTCFCGLLFIDDCCCTWMINLIFYVITFPLRMIFKLFALCCNSAQKSQKSCDEDAMDCVFCPFKCCGDCINQCWFSCDNFCCNGLNFFPPQVSQALSSNWCMKCFLQIGQFFKNCCSFVTNCCRTKNGNCCCEPCCHEIGSCCQYCCSPQGCTEQCCQAVSDLLSSLACCCDTCDCECLCCCFISTKEIAGGVVSECCCCIIKTTGEILGGFLSILN